MGGGIRAAIKLATYGFNVGLRGASSIPLQDQLSTPVRRASSKQNAVTASSVVVSSSSSSSKDGKTTDGSLHNKPSWEIDDWEFSGDEVEEMLLLDSMDPMPRVVFRGGVPTLEEATEATADVKEALEKEYFSNAIRCKNSSTAQDSALLSSGYSETKACITSESVMGHSSVPTPVFQAFSLLKESPEAQGVVASLASDKNVWDAVMQNEKVMEYIKKQQQLNALSDDDTDMKQPFSVDEKGTEGVYSGSGFMEFVDKVKITVTDIVSSLSGFFHSIFGGSIEDRISMDANGAAAVKTGVGASFMALAVLTVIVAVLKRG